MQFCVQQKKPQNTKIYYLSTVKNQEYYYYTIYFLINNFHCRNVDNFCLTPIRYLTLSHPWEHFKISKDIIV